MFLANMKSRRNLYIIITILIIICIYYFIPNGYYKDDLYDSDIPKQWLKRKISISQAELDRCGYSKDDSLLGFSIDYYGEKFFGRKPVPVRSCDGRWIKLKKLLQADDELWVFSSDEESWRRFAGRAGICIVRHGEIVIGFVTYLN